MTLTFARLLADAWTLFRREADLLVRVAGPFLFLPAFALLLLTDPLPVWPGRGADEAALADWFRAVEAWMGGNAHWHLLAAATSIYGQAVIATALLGPPQPLGDAMRTAARRYGRFLLAGALVQLAFGLGFLAFILPGLILYARFIAVVPVVVRERVSAVGALGRSVAVTRGTTLAVLGALAMLWVIQWFAILPLAPLAAWLRQPGHANPLAIALVEAGVAAASAGHALGVLLVGIAVYRRLASRGT